MSEPTPSPDMKIDILTMLPTIAKYYQAFHWMLPFLGVEIPAEAHEVLIAIASGREPNLEQIKTLREAMEPMIGEPVMTRQLAEDAWFLHYKEGMGTREIAEAFTKEGSPCSHATVARWINMVDAERKASKIQLIISISKYGIIVLLWIISIYVVHLFW